MIKQEKKYKYPSKKDIIRMCDEALNQDTREDIIREIKYLKNK